MGVVQLGVVQLGVVQLGIVQMGVDHQSSLPDACSMASLLRRLYLPRTIVSPYEKNILSVYSNVSRYSVSVPDDTNTHLIDQLLPFLKVVLFTHEL